MLDTRSADEATPDATEAAGRSARAGLHPGIHRFARDSPLEEDGFEPPVPVEFRRDVEARHWRQGRRERRSCNRGSGGAMIDGSARSHMVENF
jgi:hypothetical protein